MNLKGSGWECMNFVHVSGEGWLVCSCEPGSEKIP